VRAEGESVKLLVISPTANAAHAERMIATARRVGIEPLLYGFNSNHPHGKDYQGTDIVNILTERTDAEYVMGIDAPDVAFLAGEDEIMEKFATFEYPMIVSAEWNGVGGLRKTKDELYRQCMEAGGYHSQLNIGCWVGQREYALHVLNEAERLYKDRPEDPDYSYDNHFQYLCLMKAWGGGPEFHIDTHCVLFQSMSTAETELVGGRIRNTITGTYPPVLHFNGDPTRGAYGRMVEEILR